jgi:hypothetical protein
MPGNVTTAKKEVGAALVRVTRTGLAAGNPVPLISQVSEKERVSGSVSHPAAIAERVKVKAVGVRRSVRFGGCCTIK